MEFEFDAIKSKVFKKIDVSSESQDNIFGSIIGYGIRKLFGIK